ncbi:MAG: TIGR00296 family protein [Candidatus Methanoperedens sp.]|nr:TIGR00296 family protein [Candidatus Methanoperedens sp.]MCZ7359588.1 TIGR00296 family protein [Candidatus Methanoperedens sp.]HLB72241.1 TIGR00296 family protein [Candidatus Methanoperedens sp.]
MLTKTEGETAVRLARRAMEECLRNKIKIMPDNLPSLFKEKRGVFVTLNKKKTIKELRGCIGRPYPILPLGEAIIVSAINAAREDPRFDPVEPGEIGDLVIEVTVLTLPRKIKAKPRDIPDKIKIGRDGLIIATGRCQGLLLPQVAVEHGFDCSEFLCQTSMKAGLMPDAWLNGADVYSFQGQIFEEIEPGGEIREKILSNEC